jgi:nucleotidyltransferase/DNA polymerase involved in DNA repair
MPELSTFSARDLTKDDREALYKAIGKLVVNWAHVDRALDFWISVIYHDVGGKNVENKLPHGFDRKKRFLRRCFRQIEALRPFSEDALSYIDAAEHYSNTRHFVVHGALSGYDATDHAFTFLNLRPNEDKSRHKLSALRITATELLDDGEQCSFLVGEMHELAFKLIAAFDRQ